MTNWIGNFLLHDLTITPPALLTSSAKTSVSLRQRSASVENGPVSDTVVPNTIGPSQELSFAATGAAATRASAAPASF